MAASVLRAVKQGPRTISDQGRGASGHDEEVKSDQCQCLTGSGSWRPRGEGFSIPE